MVASAPVMPLASRDQTPFGMPYRTQGGQAAVDILSLPTIDSGTLSVLMRISTDCVDRERMVVNQDGLDFTNYISNPVVLYGHGEQGIVLPVAISEDEDGNCTVTRKDDGTYARAFHKSMDKMSMQIFDAVSCGLLRASSIGLTPVTISVRYDSQGRKVPVVDEAIVNEWSYCAVGVNQETHIVKSLASSPYSRESVIEAFALQSEAVLRILDSGTLDGSGILPVIRRSLMAIAPQAPKRTSPEFGYSPLGENNMPLKQLTKSQVRSMSNRVLMKSLAKMLEFDEPTQKMLSDVSEERLEEPADGPDDFELDSGFEGEGDDDTGAERQGSTVTRAGYDSLTSAVETFRSQLETVEADAFKAKVDSQLQAIVDALEAIAGYHAEQYPDAPSIAEEEIDTEADMLKSLWKINDGRRVSAGQINRTIHAAVKRIESGKFDAAQITKSLKRSAGNLSRMIVSAKEVSVVSGAEYEALKAENARLTENLGKLVDRLDLLDSQPAKIA